MGSVTGSIEMNNKTSVLFLGNDGNLVRALLNLKKINVSGIVADKTTDLEAKYFGSAFSVAKSKGIPLVSQAFFNRNYNASLKTFICGTNIIFMQGYHYKIKKDLLRINRIKVINFHQSLLPAYAGRHPLNWAIINGEKSAGVTFHFANEEFDAGNIILQDKIKINDSDTVIDVYNSTIIKAKLLLPEVLRLAGKPYFSGIPQDGRLASYYPPRKPRDGRICAGMSALAIKNLVRALVEPYPGAYFYHKRKKIIVDKVEIVEKRCTAAEPGIYFLKNGRYMIKAMDGWVKVLESRGPDKTP